MATFQSYENINLSRISGNDTENIGKKDMSDTGKVTRRSRQFCSAHSAKIAFYIRIFGAFNQIMIQPAMFLFFFSIPR